MRGNTLALATSGTDHEDETGLYTIYASTEKNEAKKTEMM